MNIPEHGCAGCDNRWNGPRATHCGGCHHTFTTLSTFDKHRDGSHSNGTRVCLEPEQAGLVKNGRAYPCWSQPGDDYWESEAAAS